MHHMSHSAASHIMLAVPQQENVEGGQTILVTCEKGFQQTTMGRLQLACAGRSTSPCERSLYHVGFDLYSYPEIRSVSVISMHIP